MYTQKLIKGKKYTCVLMYLFFDLPMLAILDATVMT